MASRTTAACRRLLLLAVLLVLALPASAQDVQLVFVDSPSLLNRVYLYPSSFTPPIPHDPTVYTIRSPPPANPYACPSLSPIPSLPPSTLLLVLRGGPPSSSPCTFVDKAHVAQAAGAALMVVIDAQNSTGGGMGGDAFAGQTVLSAMATWEDGQALEALDGQTVSVRLYVRPVWDVSFLLMFLMALATLVGAAWLSAAKERKLEGRGRRSGGGGAGEYGVADEDVETVAYLDVAAAAGFVVVASGALLLLYFFIERPHLRAARPVRGGRRLLPRHHHRPRALARLPLAQPQAARASSARRPPLHRPLRGARSRGGVGVAGAET